MSDDKIKLLVINDDKDTESPIRGHLDEDIYSIDFETNWKRSLGKILESGYNLIVLSTGLTKVKDGAGWFLQQLEIKQPEKLDLPFVISKGTKEKVEFLNKNSKHIESNLAEKMMELENKIAVNAAGIDVNKKTTQNLSNRIKAYIKWENIAETLDILVGDFSLAIGIVITIITLLFKQSMVISNFGISAIPLLVSYAVVIIFTWLITHILSKKSIMRKVDEKILGSINNHAEGTNG